MHFPNSVEAVLDVSKLHQGHILVAVAAQDLHPLHLSELFEDVFQVVVLAGLAPQRGDVEGAAGRIDSD